MRPFFSCKYQIFRVKENHKIKHNVNDFDFCFVPKCLHISNSRTKLAGLHFQHSDFQQVCIIYNSVALCCRWQLVSYIHLGFLNMANVPYIQQCIGCKTFCRNFYILNAHSLDVSQIFTIVIINFIILHNVLQSEQYTY